VSAFADELGVIARADVEDEPAVVHLDQLSGGDHMATNWSRGQMSHVYHCADGRLARRKLWLNEEPRGILHEPDHGRSAQYMDATRAKGRRSLLLANGESRLALHSERQRHSAVSLLATRSVPASLSQAAYHIADHIAGHNPDNVCAGTAWARRLMVSLSLTLGPFEWDNSLM
jgi:hypothetical protein